MTHTAENTELCQKLCKNATLLIKLLYKLRLALTGRLSKWTTKAHGRCSVAASQCPHTKCLIQVQQENTCPSTPRGVKERKREIPTQKGREKEIQKEKRREIKRRKEGREGGKKEIISPYYSVKDVSISWTVQDTVTFEVKILKLKSIHQLEDLVLSFTSNSLSRHILVLQKKEGSQFAFGF